MNKLAASLAVCGLIFGLGAGSALAHDHHHNNNAFSNAGLAGTYAASFQGTVAGTGVLVSDGNGNITGGTETVNDGTNVCTGSLSGTYAINPDGTGVMDLDFTTTATLAGTCPTTAVSTTSALVIVSAKCVKVSQTDPGFVENGSLERQHLDSADKQDNNKDN